MGNHIPVTNLINHQILIRILCSGANWKHVEGAAEGQTATCRRKLDEIPLCTFAHPIDCHLACRGIQGWPKLHLEVFAVNAANNCWPIGYENQWSNATTEGIRNVHNFFRFGFGFIPSQPGCHTLKINTWKVATHNLVDSLKIRFNTGGYTVSKSDLVYSGVDRWVTYIRYIFKNCRLNSCGSWHSP